MQETARWAVVAAACLLPVTVQAQSTTWHDDSFTDSTGRTLLYRLWVKSDWALSDPRGILLFLHGNGSGTAEDLRQVRWSVIEESLDFGLAVVVPASPFSTPEDLPFDERILVGPVVGGDGTRFWDSSDARLIHELLQSGLDGRLAIDYDKVVFSGASQGTCFLAEFVEYYGGSYGGGFHAWCGCFWLDFDGDDSHNTYAITPPFLASPWRPTFQWTPAATDAARDRFSVFVEATTGDFLYPAAVSMSRYYSEWLGLRTATDLDASGGHCSKGATSRRAIYDWLLSGARRERAGSTSDTDGDGTPDLSDLDDDNDGAPDFIDALPRDPVDWRDTDADGIADARDRDADGDGVWNSGDAFPLDWRERLDTDGDGIGNRLDSDDDNDGLLDAQDPQPLVGTDVGRNLAFVRHSAGGTISNYEGYFGGTRATVHAVKPATVVYPVPQGHVQSYQFLELGDSVDRRFEIMVDRFVRSESCPTVLLSSLCDVEQFSASGFFKTYYQNRFERIWIDRNRNRDLTDDGPPLLLASTEDDWVTITATAILEVPYALGQVLPYAISFRSQSDDPAYPDRGLEVLGGSVWRGKVAAPSGERVPVIVVDGNIDGLFDSQGDFACLDFDRDGWLNECDISEDADGNRARSGALTPPFRWDGDRQWLSVAPSGQSVAWHSANRAPVAVAGALGDQALTLPGTLEVSVSRAFVDPDGDALSYTASSSAPQVATARALGSRVTVTGVGQGTASVVVTATDPGGLSATQSFAVTVESRNEAPVTVGALPDRRLSVDGRLDVDVFGAFDDPDGDALSYTASSSAPQVATARALGSRVTVTGVGQGTASVVVTATDPGGLSATQSFAVTVESRNEAPVTVGALPDRRLSVDGRLDVDVFGAFDDPDGDALSYTASSSAPQVATARALGSRVTVTGVGQGTASVVVTATDPGGLSATQSFAVTVESRNEAPVTVGALPDRRLSVDGRLDVDVFGAFDDPDGDALSYTASSSAPQVATARALGARVTVTAVGIGLASIVVTATDPDGLSAAQSFGVRVTALFSDDPIRPRVTPIRAVHFTELRTRIDVLREEAGLGGFRWTDPVLRAGVTRVRLVHLLEMREALSAAYAAAARPPPRWGDTAPAGGATPIRAAHVTELRAAVMALE